MTAAEREGSSRERGGGDNRRPGSASEMMIQQRTALDKEADDLREDVRQFRAGALSRAAFKARRVLQGLYSQRQSGAYMLRLKVPGGSLTADQLDCIAAVTERFTARGQAHLTARQDVQLHFLRLDDVPEVLRQLSGVGLTSREAGGPTVWSAAACPLAGVCAHEAFDVMPYAASYSEHFLRHPVVQNLPRKFKTAFSGCAADCGLTAIQDLGFVAVRQGDGDGARAGFRVVVGGGLATHPKYARTLHDFVPVEDYLRVSEAILRVFDRMGPRVMKQQARFKYLVDEMGIEALRAAVDRELESLPRDGCAAIADEPPMEAYTGAEPQPCSEEPDGAFDAWTRTNVVAQRQAGYVAVYVTVPLGNLSPAQMRALAELSRRHARGEVRATQRQDVLVPWVPEADVRGLYAALAEAGLAEPGANGVLDMAVCPGSEACGYGVTNSMALARVLRDRLSERPDLMAHIGDARINISGCGYSCGRHQLGNIGLAGTAVPSDGRLVPAYRVFLGGRMPPRGHAMGERLAVFPASELPDAVLRLFEHYVSDRLDGEETFEAYVERCWPVAAMASEDVSSASIEAYAVEELDAKRQELRDRLASTIAAEDAPAPADGPAVDWGASAPFELQIGEAEARTPR